MIANAINFTKSYNRLKVKIMWQSIQTINKEKYIYIIQPVFHLFYITIKKYWPPKIRVKVEWTHYKSEVWKTISLGAQFSEPVRKVNFLPYLQSRNSLHYPK